MTNVRHGYRSGLTVPPGWTWAELSGSMYRSDDIVVRLPPVNDGAMASVHRLDHPVSVEAWGSLVRATVPNKKEAERIVAAIDPHEAKSGRLVLFLPYKRNLLQVIDQCVPLWVQPPTPEEVNADLSKRIERLETELTELRERVLQLELK